MRRLALSSVTALVLALMLSGPASAWTWPVQGAVLRPFSLGADAFAGGQHRGIDIRGSAGEDVLAPAAGTVTFAGTVPTHGRAVTITTADGLAVTLTHLGTVRTERGAVVAEGVVVATTGSSGTSEHAVPYVHLGIRVAADDHGYLDPARFLPPRESPASQGDPSMPVSDPVPTSAPSPGAEPPGPVGSPGAGSSTPAAPPSSPALPRGAPGSASDAPLLGSSTVTPAVAAGDRSTAPVTPRPPGGAQVDTSQGTDRTYAATPSPRPSPAGATDGRRSSHETGADGPRAAVASSAASAEPSVSPPHRTAAESASAHGERWFATWARPPGEEAWAVVERASGRASASGIHASRGVAGSAGEAGPTAELVDDPERAASIVAGLIVLAGALLAPTVVAGATRRRPPRRIGRDGALLRHDADLLRQLDAAHRSRLHHDRRGRLRAASAAARA